MKSLRPFRFGITSNGTSSLEDWQVLARKVEAQGYSTLLLNDHLHTALGPIAALFAAADATTTLRVGSYVFGNDFRHPVFLAKDTATIDLLSGGRFELGIGSGWLHDDYEKAGIPFDAPGVRISRLQESVQIVKGLWADPPFSFAGEHYHVNDLNGIPKPAQKPHPPIMIGGGTKRVLSFAATEADIVSINFRTTNAGKADLDTIKPEAMDQRVMWVRDAAGERFDALELNNYAFMAAVTDDPFKVAEQTLKMLGVEMDRREAGEWLASPALLAGSVDQIIQTLQMRRERFGFSYIVLRQSVADEFAPVVERLAGA